mgnify:CR=1 FL=1
MTISFARPVAPLLLLFLLVPADMALATSLSSGVTDKKGPGSAPEPDSDFDWRAVRINGITPSLVGAGASRAGRGANTPGAAADRTLASETLVEQVLQPAHARVRRR